jgi:peptidoglycan/xylan/chitin deacetylase (PgdA/CDA1 family)
MFSMERAAQMEPRRNLVRRRKQRQRRMVALVGLLGLVVVVLGTLQLAGTFDAGPRIVIADPGALRLPVYPTPLQAKDPGPVAARAAEQIDDGVLNRIPVGLAVAHAGRGRPWIALTFDDGPSPYTLDVLRILARFHQHATFFVTGYASTMNPFLLLQIRAGGNSFGNHTVTHTQLTREKPAKRRWELLSTAERVQGPTGVRPTLFRPPYGESSRRINTMSRQLGMLPITWSTDSKDWMRPGVKKIVANVLKGAVPGGIILMHDGGGNRAQTLKALPLILKALAKRHLVSVTLPRLLNSQMPEHGDLVVRS